MPLAWNEIRHNAVAFARDWASESRESAESQAFWNEFFAVFGIKRRTVASFEEPVKKLSGSWGAIDLFWPATLLVEHKSRGQPLDKAESQALEYIRGLKDAGRDAEIPRYVVVSDFARIALHDLEENTSTEIPVLELHRHVARFAFIPSYQSQRLDPEDPVNLAAVELLGELHDSLNAGGYSGQDLERFLVRVLFCLFAEDTGLFERNAFTAYVLNLTAEDGSDLGMHLARLFQVLNAPAESRQANLLDELAALPYVNGDLFSEALGFADFNRDMRDRLLACCRFDWSRISPAVFGSLFQSVMEARERRQVGAHYTSERDILKLVRSLFLDELRAEFERLKKNKNRTKLKEFHRKLGRLHFLDPACGCGNFLVVTYRELRLLEIEVLKAVNGAQLQLDIHQMSLVDVDAMYGIEINEFPARIAEVALWLVDHQMNQRLNEAFGQYFVRLPLKKSATIRHGNALRFDWHDVLPPERCSFVLGNPPFVGKKVRSEEQQADMQLVFGSKKGTGELDYVACWYARAADYLNGTDIRAAFVSTNSITQGEQPGLLWPGLLARGVRIQFAHRTFAWESEARGKAHVHVVIVGFGYSNAPDKWIHDYESGRGKAVSKRVSHINPYLVEASDTLLTARSKPMARVPPIRFGNMPNDDGQFLFTDQEKKTFVRDNPGSAALFRRFLSAKEYLNGETRWCLWMQDASPKLLRSLRGVMQRIKAVADYRTDSTRVATQKLAETPALFGEIRQPKTKYILVPRHSSENRRYIPMSYFAASHIVADSCLFIADASLYHFGVVGSAMHMAWVKQVCGRIKSDFRYSNELVYNNFPWPESPAEKLQAAVAAKAQKLLDARASFSGASLADLYDPVSMPVKLAKAHAELDRAVDACYRKKPFGTDRERVEFLFGLHEKLTAPLIAGLRQVKHGRSQR